MKNLIVLSAACAASAAFAAPVVSDVVLSQNGGTVAIDYKLANETGIVTVDVQTNAGNNVWVSVGGEHLTHFAGDANRKIEPGTRRITWKPRKAWPDNEVTENVKAVVSAWSVSAPPDYMAVSLTIPGEICYYTCAESVPFGATNDLYKTECLLFRKIPAANVRWRMGSPTTESFRIANREMPHVVTLADDYYLGVYPVTQRQYQYLMNARPSKYNLESDYAMRPVEQVSYEDLRGPAASGFSWPSNGHAVKADGFIGKLRTHAGLTGFDLPLEAQWEFACRAGCGASLYNGQELDGQYTAVNLAPLGRYANNGGRIGGKDPEATCTAENGTAKVGSYAPNAWGLYDMLGNVSELCLDFFQESFVGIDPATGPDTGLWGGRVVRGGGWDAQAETCRCGVRAYNGPADKRAGSGFRLCCTIDAQ